MSAQPPKAALLCLGCDQPMLPPGVEKRPNEYDHAQGCPEPTIEKLHLPSRIRRGRASTDPTWKVVRGDQTLYFKRKREAEEFAVHGCTNHHEISSWSCAICCGRTSP